MLDIYPPEAPPMDPKPARRYIAKALPARDDPRFYAQFAVPGLPPRYVQERGAPVLYDGAVEAENAAMAALIHFLNNRPGMPSATRTKTIRATGERITREVRGHELPERYDRLPGPDFSILLAETNLTPTFFSFLSGSRMESIVRWMDAAEEKDRAPHVHRLLLELFKRHPETIDTAEELTNQVTSSAVGRADEFRTMSAKLTNLIRSVEPHLETPDDFADYQRATSNEEGLNMRQRIAILQRLAERLSLKPKGRSHA